MASSARNGQLGVALANMLGLKLPKREGHDLAGPCIACASSDAFRMHSESGVGHCYSCDGKWSPFQLSEAVLNDRDQAKTVLVQLGIFKADPSSNGKATPLDPLAFIAKQKGISAESLKAFGAKATSPTSIALPAFGPDGKPCSSFSMLTIGGKGLFAKGKPAGLFFPHVDGKVRIPKPGEVWHLVEGPKDSAALYGLGLLACGVNTCRLATKFARLFAGCDIVLVPDRDRAGEEGGEFTSRVLRGVAKSVRVAVLPAEFKESDGEDVRDVLRRSNGRELVLQAIADAKPPDGWDAKSTGEPSGVATAEVALTEGEPIVLEISPPSGKGQRLVVARRGDEEYRDNFNTNSGTSRDRWVKRVAKRWTIDETELASKVEPELSKLAREVDQKAGGKGGRDEDQSQATILVELAAEWHLWHTPAKEAYATIPVGEHEETWPVRSSMFKRYLSKCFYDETESALNSEALNAAVNTLEAKALFEGEEKGVFVRVAEHNGAIYLDLCNPEWQLVEINRDGWQIVSDAPVQFRRSRGMLPLPIPERGGSIDLLRGLLNVDDSTWCLIVAWLIASLRPRGPYPLMALFAEQGSGKTTAGRLLRDLVDPNAAPLRAEPRDGRDLMIAANNAWVIAFDNLSHIPLWLSDALCRVSTGGGFATRELYTDQDEIIFDSQRPTFLTSIDEVATRSDLLERCLIIALPTIPEDRRRPEAELLDEYERVRPFILGALLDAVVVALNRLPLIKPEKLPRMADFAIWATAAETAFGWPEGTFLAAYHGNRDSANDVALDASPIARPLLEHMEEKWEWSGTLSELLAALEERVTDTTKKQRDWPKNGRSLSSHLKRVAPNLRVCGWDVTFDRSAKHRLCVITRIEPSVASSSASSPEPHAEMQGDADRGDAYEDDGSDADDANSRRFGSDEESDEVPF